jgi:putative flavoprotein involved in K+ transport
MGFATDYSFIELPAFEDSGYPKHDRGVTPVPGLYFLGLPWMYTWGSGRFCGVARDAEHLAQKILQSRSAEQGVSGERHDHPCEHGLLDGVALRLTAAG